MDEPVFLEPVSMRSGAKSDRSVNRFYIERMTIFYFENTVPNKTSSQSIVLDKETPHIINTIFFLKINNNFFEINKLYDY